MTLKLALTGRVCTGKTERSTQLQTILPGALRLSFATPVKAEVAKAHGIPIVELERRKAEFRDELQRVGFEGRPWRWVLAMQDLLDDLNQLDLDTGKEALPALIIDDMRFQNEVDLLRDYGFYTVRLTAPKDVLFERYRQKHGKYPTQEQWDHESESGIAGLTVDTEWDATGPPNLQIRAWLAAQTIVQTGRLFRGIGKTITEILAS